MPLDSRLRGNDVALIVGKFQSAARLAKPGRLIWADYQYASNASNYLAARDSLTHLRSAGRECESHAADESLRNLE